MAEEQPSFEKAYSDLEIILQQLEDGKLSLEESIAQYQQGMQLILFCKQQLHHAELKIQEVSADFEGGMKTKPIEAPSQKLKSTKPTDTSY
ncbi:MAG: exodeoxyribonuclease VII small subunit [Zavarzinella sp.]